MNRSFLRNSVFVGCAVMLASFSLGGCSSSSDDKNNATGSPAETARSPQAKAGTYTASERGYGGEVTINVKIADDGSIEDVSASCPNETETVGQKAAPIICQEVMDKQSPTVDTVSGATVTSNAVLSAIETALNDAGWK